MVGGVPGKKIKEAHAYFAVSTERKKFKREI
jgi:hypothetical protein